MILKSFVVEKDIKILNSYSAALFYGENIGLKDELKKDIKNLYKNFEYYNFDQSDILKNKKILEEQMNNTSLFSKNKIIFVNGISEKIKNIILPVLEEIDKNLKIFLFSENLEKKSSLRANFEKNKKLAVIPCYQDNERTLSEYIRKKLVGYVGLNQEIINILINNSGLDRKTISMEIDKICNLFLDKKIDTKKLNLIINNRHNVDFDNLKDNCFAADGMMLNKNLGSVIIQNENAYYYLNSLQLRVKRLSELAIEYEKINNYEAAMENIKPKIFWKDKPIFLKQIKVWNKTKLEKANKLIIDTEISMKTKLNNYNTILIKNLLIKLYSIANSTS